MDCKKTADNIIAWIQQTVRTAGFTGLVIGVSGGVDSAVSTALAVRAIGEKNIYPVLLPYGKLHNHSVRDAKKLVTQLQIPKKQITIIDITKAVDTIWVSAAHSNIVPDLSSVRKGNIMARVRMIYLFDLAKKLNALVCGTENKTEHYLGYFTRYGDSASDIEPIQGLYKTQVWQMATYVKIPESIITKAPTAGLWEEQTDEKELGFLYKEADEVLFWYFDKKLSAGEIIEKGIVKETVEKVLERVRKNEFKQLMPLVYAQKTSYPVPK